MLKVDLEDLHKKRLKTKRLKLSTLKRWERLKNTGSKNSLVKTQDKLEIARNSAAFFYHNMHNLEEALGGNESDIYRRSLYGLFQIDKSFRPKYESSLTKYLSLIIMFSSFRASKNRSEFNKYEILSQSKKREESSGFSPHKKILEQCSKIDPKDLMEFERASLNIVKNNN